MRRYLPALLLALALDAQPPAVAGTWTLTYDADVRRDGDRVQVRGRRNGTLVLTQHGDSIAGTWEGMPSHPVAVTGRIDGSTIRFGTAWRGGDVLRDGKKVDGAEMRTEFHGTLQRGAMAGTMYIRLRFDGAEREPPARAWEAVRRAGG